MSAYAKGPWRIEAAPHTGIRVQTDDVVIAQVITTYAIGRTNVTPEDAEANARLIAAAPELLEALRSLVGVFRDGNARFEDFDRAADEANRVIAKVEGRS